MAWVETLTRNVDIAFLSVRLSVTIRYFIEKTQYIVIVFFHHTVAQTF